jgi:Ca2+-transporting ATPase
MSVSSSSSSSQSSGSRIPSGNAPRGLSSSEALDRLSLSGPNRVPAPTAPLGRMLRDSLSLPLVVLLLAVGVIYVVIGQLRDAVVIFAVIFVVVWVELVIRWRASRAVATLSKLSAPNALVWRDGELQEMAPERLVRDDVIMLGTGSRVPADARLVEAEKFLVDESLVTGEPQPIEHGVGGGLNPNLSAGSHVVRGRGIAIVTAVGRESALGKVAGMVDSAEVNRTPLQRQMARLARVLLLAAILCSIAVAGIAYARGLPVQQMIVSGLTLAFATVPAELPVLVVVVLGLGSLRLARQGAIVRNLRAAETLGAITLVCTDKTGTLTRNRIALTATMSADDVMRSPADREVSGGRIEYVKNLARLASDPPAGDDPRATDPIDLAIWRASSNEWPEPTVRFGFDDGRRLASGLAHISGQMVLGVKGATEAVVVRSSAWRSRNGIEALDEHAKSRVIQVAAELAEGGGRVLAVASREFSGPPQGGPTVFETDLVFEGLLLCTDTLRPEVPVAMRDLFRNGVSVCMVTGDQQATAGAIGRAAGLGGPVFIAAQTKRWEDKDLAHRASLGSVFARARPEDKLRIVQAATSAGEVVGVTGDGVNDAPALKAAAVGVAMGASGSDVAREAADLVLAADNFGTLATAVTEGRRLYQNVRKAVRYYLAVKLALVLVSLAVAVSGKGLPFSPVQILGIMVFLDIGAAIAFINQPAELDRGRPRPRPLHARIFSRPVVVWIVAGAITLAALSGVVYLTTLGQIGDGGARTLALASWLIAQTSLGAIMGWDRGGVSARGFVRNRAMLVWALVALAAAAAILALAPLQALLDSGAVPLRTALIVAGASLLVPWWLEIVRRIANLRTRRDDRPTAL